MKRILLTGRNGQVGWELERTLAPLGEVLAHDHAQLDLAEPDRIRAVVRETRPDIIVNAAAYTAVDKAEAEPQTALSINASAPCILAEEAKRLDALLVHYSTDYVFDGTKQSAYTEDDAPNPVNVYGQSKLAGEQAICASGCRHLIFRTSWVYGLRGHNFLRTILRLAAERPELKVVDDQIGAPTWSRMIAEMTALALAQPKPPIGLHHLTSAGQTSWYGFAKAILDLQGWTGQLTAIPSSAYPLPASRPTNSILDNERLFRMIGAQLPDWKVGLTLCFREHETTGRSR